MTTSFVDSFLLFVFKGNKEMLRGEVAGLATGYLQGVTQSNSRVENGCFLFYVDSSRWEEEVLAWQLLIQLQTLTVLLISCTNCFVLSLNCLIYNIKGVFSLLDNFCSPL